MNLNNLNLTVFTFRIVRAVTALTMLNPLLTGCATTILVDDVFFGDPVELDFHVVHADLPNAMVYWRESPGFYESALTFNPPYTECDKVSFYVNSIEKRDKPLTHNTKVIGLITLENESSEQALWNNIPVSDQCAVLLTVGTIKDINFTGISASTRAGHFKRVNINFPEPVPPDSSAWPGVIVAPLFDAVFWAGYVGYYPLTRPLCPSAPDSLKVSFQFPDDTFKETVITDDRAKVLVVEQFHLFGTGADMYCPIETCASYWLIAAMLDLRIDFRYGSGPGELSIEGYQDRGPLKYRINGGTQIKSDYCNIGEDTHQIEFILSDIPSKEFESGIRNPGECTGTWEEIKDCF